MSELLDPQTRIATWHLGPFAEVRVGEHVTRYVRRGTGSCVLVLIGDSESNPVWAPLIDSLAASHKVVIPQPTPDTQRAATCLRGFIEGIGASEIAMIAGGSAVAAALDVASADDFTVRKLIILAKYSSNHATSETVLWISPDEPAAQSLQRIAEFLSG